MADNPTPTGGLGDAKDGVEQALATNLPGEHPTSAQTPQKASGNDITQTSPRQGHQRLVFTDPVAFRYLEEDPSTVVLDRRRRLEGYEIYLVEQWACSRVHPTFIIATYTGDPSHSILVSVLSVPTDESTWSPRLRVYFKAISQFHARKKETPIGTLMVTNLSGFPSALTVIVIPDGDVKKHREDFIVNEDLKRLGCSGRAGLTVQYPTTATQAKFHQLYRTSDKIPLYSAVMELVKLCQVALTIFSKLAPEYADGLLCDVTEKAINDWWTDIGTDFFNVEPSDGILGPTTVAALLGMVMGARNRLNAFGAPVGKDVFDVMSLKRGIGYFQKAQKLEKTRRLDHQTLDKLHRVTAKAANSEGWTVPKAVKSTVAELSGKGGEMVMGMVGARDKAGIAEVETLDIERFVQLVHGERAKWLWHGKPRKSGSGDIFDHHSNNDGMIFSGDDQGGYVWTSGKRDSVAESIASRPIRSNNESLTPQNSQLALDDKDQQSRKNKSKGMGGRVTDARSGFGRFKDAVGLPRSHHHKHSKEDPGFDYEGGLQYAPYGSELTLNTTRSWQPSSPDLREKSNRDLGQPFQPLDEGSTTKLDHPHTVQEWGEVNYTHSPPRDDEAEPEPEPKPDPDPDPEPDHGPEPEPEPEPEIHVPAYANMYPEPAEQSDRNDEEEPTLQPQMAREKYDEVVLDLDNSGQHIKPGLRKTESSYSLSHLQVETFTVPRYPRNLSFSVAEDAVLTWEDIGGREPPQSSDSIKPALGILRERAASVEARYIGMKISSLELMAKSWVESKMKEIDDLDQLASNHQEELKTQYYQRLEHCQALRVATENILAEDRSSLTDALREIEVLGAKLEYELNALQSRVKDVEDGVAEFERHVIDSEARVNELMAEKHDTGSWTSWFQDFLTFSWNRKRN
jgi:hypothetical protein